MLNSLKAVKVKHIYRQGVILIFASVNRKDGKLRFVVAYGGDTIHIGNVRKLFGVVLIAAISLKAGFNIFLNVVATAGWITSAVLLSISVTNAMSNSIDVFSGNVIWWGYAIGAALFLANVVISVVASKSFKKQLSSQPTMDEYIANELEEIRTQA